VQAPYRQKRLADALADLDGAATSQVRGWPTQRAAVGLMWCIWLRPRGHQATAHWQDGKLQPLVTLSLVTCKYACPLLRLLLFSCTSSPVLIGVSDIHMIVHPAGAMLGWSGPAAAQQQQAARRPSLLHRSHGLPWAALRSSSSSSSSSRGRKCGSGTGR
jgi:hypothetical protein